MEDEFKRIKKRINRDRGVNDVSIAGRNIGFSTTTFYSAMKKEIFKELTAGERTYINEMVRLLDERDREISEMAKSLAKRC